LRLPHHRIAVPEADRGLVERMMIELAKDPLSPPDARQLATTLAVDVKKLVGLLRALERQQTLVNVAPDLYFLRETVDNVREDLVRDLSLIGEVTTAQFRDRYKTSRKYAIPLLEHFDRIGVTIRIGEVRRLRNPQSKRESS
jgi:selenocysteine-specific elongation factor